MPGWASNSSAVLRRTASPPACEHLPIPHRPSLLPMTAFWLHSQQDCQLQQDQTLATVLGEKNLPCHLSPNRRNQPHPWPQCSACGWRAQLAEASPTTKPRPRGMQRSTQAFTKTTSSGAAKGEHAHHHTSLSPAITPEIGKAADGASSKLAYIAYRPADIGDGWRRWMQAASDSPSHNRLSRQRHSGRNTRPIENQDQNHWQPLLHGPDSGRTKEKAHQAG